jgi:leader peptidase (prepilin peptidase)/N-methyltransferase
MTTASLFTPLAAITGAAIGSFLNVVIYRLPHGFHLGLPSRSACPKCKRRLRWYENIPILSYLVLRGRCAGCSSLVSLRYPLVEVLTALLFVAVYKYFGISLSTLYYWVFVAALLAITFIDLDHRIIPDAISLPLAALGVAGSFLIPQLGILSSVLGVLLGGGLFWFMGWAYEKATGREGLGFGDVKMLAMIGAFLGPKGTIGTILISSVSGSIVGLVLMIAHKKNLKLAIPYGPFLALGALIYLFWGDDLVFRFYPMTYE